MLLDSRCPILMLQPGRSKIRLNKGRSAIQLNDKRSLLSNMKKCSKLFKQFQASTKSGIEKNLCKPLSSWIINPSSTILTTRDFSWNVVSKIPFCFWRVTSGVTFYFWFYFASENLAWILLVKFAFQMSDSSGFPSDRFNQVAITHCAPIKWDCNVNSLSINQRLFLQSCTKCKERSITSKFNWHGNSNHGECRLQNSVSLWRDSFQLEKGAQRDQG